MSEHTYCGAGLSTVGRLSADGREWICGTCGRLYRCTLIVGNSPVWTEVRGPVLPSEHTHDVNPTGGGESQPAPPRRQNRGGTDRGR